MSDGNCPLFKNNLALYLCRVGRNRRRLAGLWGWLQNGKSPLWGLLGGAVLFVYGVIPTLQAEPAFGRVYAAYGGIFILLSIQWGRVVDGWQPDRFRSHPQQ